ncbi:MAG: M23 family metallopeptidase [Thermodesulfobacteriota bacterium]
MIKKQISFLLFNEADYSTRQFAASRGVLLLAVMSILAMVCLTGFAAVRCNDLRQTITAAALMEEASRDQRQRAALQGRQIDLLNEKIAGLTEKIEHLRSLKMEICRIGRIEQAIDNENLFGVGGSRIDDTSSAAGEEQPAGPPAKGGGPESTVEPVALDVLLSDPPATSESAFLLSPSDFHINPIACIPSSLPLNGAVSKTPRSPRQPVAAGGGLHRGIMLETVQGDEILAPANGIVSFVDDNNSNGNTIVIDHGHGIIARYTGLTSAARETGSLVLKGEVIGLAEKSLSEKSSRFYYEIMVDGLPVHPEKLIAHTAFLP